MWLCVFFVSVSVMLHGVCLVGMLVCVCVLRLRVLRVMYEVLLYGMSFVFLVGVLVVVNLFV